MGPVVKYSKTSFYIFNISTKTISNLNSLGYYYPTTIQKKCIPYALKGRDIMVSAKTGSGKTLCFVIPIIEKLVCKNWTKNDSIGGYTICPVRELSIQIYAIFQQISSGHNINIGLLIGGTRINNDKKNSQIIVGTIGKLCEKIFVDKYFNLDYLKILCIDEIDQILDLGFKRSFFQILKNIPKNKQTLLFSATLTTKIRDIIRLNLLSPIFLCFEKKNFKKLQENNKINFILPKNLFQYYCLVDFNQKTNFLFSFLTSHQKNKIIVIFSTNKRVIFFYEIFQKIKPDFLLFQIHGSMKQDKRTLSYISFNQSSSGILFATDLISRGIDIKSVDWVIQSDCPRNIKTYIHRIGRTGRLSEIGKSLVILTKEETYFLDELQKFSITILKIKLREKQITNVFKRIYDLVNNNEVIFLMAHNAYINYVRNVFSVQYSKNRSFSEIDWKKTGENYGIKVE